MNEHIGFEPLDDHVVIRRCEADEQTPGGILLPEAAKERPQRGEVVAVGPGARIHGSQSRAVLYVYRGETVLYAKYAGSEIRVDGETFVVIRENEILGVLRPRASEAERFEVQRT